MAEPVAMNISATCFLEDASSAVFGRAGRLPAPESIFVFETGDCSGSPMAESVVGGAGKDMMEKDTLSPGFVVVF
jgi:hypothetical protein